MQAEKRNLDLNRAAFERAAARYILGESPGLELQGTQQQVRAATAALEESRSLLRSLRDGDLRRVRTQLQQKRTAAAQFREVYGYVWPF